MMKKTDLITGMLGAGKTTFITTYARHMAEKCGPVCLIANDYGAISVDRALLEEKIGDLCDIEMVVAGDPDCQRRRFRTKLISMGMLGYERVIVEPSGVFDTEEFYNILYDDPISSWYEIGNVISIVPADIPEELPESSEYLLADQAATAGLIVVSKVHDKDIRDIPGTVERIRRRLQRAGDKFHCTRDFLKAPVLVRKWEDFTEEDWEKIEHAGRVSADMVRMHFAEDGSFQSLFYFHVNRSEADMRALAAELLSNRDRFGQVIRIKGFFHDTETNAWMSLNATAEKTEIRPSATKKDDREEVIIVVGGQMNEKAIGEAFGETRSVTDYSI